MGGTAGERQGDGRGNGGGDGRGNCRGKRSGTGDLYGAGGVCFCRERFALSESGFAGFGDFQDGWRPVECWNCRG